jgi:hypothetical protein
MEQKFYSHVTPLALETQHRLRYNAIKPRAIPRAFNPHGGQDVQGNFGK